jgi:hypothetical protein
VIAANSRVIEEHALAVVDVAFTTPQYNTAAHEMTFTVVPQQLPPLAAPRPCGRCSVALPPAVSSASSVELSPLQVPLRRHAT